MVSSILYQALDAAAAQIRHVTIEPGAWEDDIRCTLQAVSLKDPPPYEALSYTWGDSTITKAIELNGQSFQVTVNLESALRHLRGPERRTMWIDALCINQSDIEERSLQIPYMRDIYKQAENTVVWLGEETVESKSAFRLITEFYDVPSSDGSGDVETVNDLAEFLERHAWARESVDHFGNDVLKRLWWTRAWVLQEAALSRDLTLKCGNDELSWLFFKVFASALSARLVMSSSGPSSMYLLDEALRIAVIRKAISGGKPVRLSHLMAWNSWRQATDPRDRVFSLIGMSTDPKESALKVDYSPSNQLVDVFRQLVQHSVSTGSLDIICMSHYVEGSSWPSWIPDWDARTDHTGDSPTRSGAAAASSLIFGFSDPHQVYQSDRSSNSSESTPFYHSDYVASLGMDPKCSILDQPPALRAAGVCIDSVDILSEEGCPDGSGLLEEIESWGDLISSRFKRSKRLVPSADNFSIGDVTNWRREIHQVRLKDPATINRIVARSLREPEEKSQLSLLKKGKALLKRMFGKTKSPHGAHAVATGDDISDEEAIVETTNWRQNHPRWGVGYSVRDGTSHSGWNYEYACGGTVAEAYWRTLLLDRASPGTRLDEYAPWVLGFKALNPGASDSDDDSDVMGVQGFLHGAVVWDKNITHGTSSRRLMISSAKGIIGLVPAAARKGDLLCVLFGCSVPVVIRKVGDHHVFLGECYLHGFMDGGAIKALEQGALSEEEFELR